MNRHRIAVGRYLGLPAAVADSLTAMKISSKISRVSARFVYLGLAAVGTWLLLAAGSAQAATVTVGSSLTGPFGPGMCSAVGGCSSANTKLTVPGALVTSPVSGTIVRWRIAGASATTGYAIRVFKPAGGTSLTGAGTGSSQTPAGSGVETFSADLPIEAGDLVGLNVPSGGAVGLIAAGGTYDFIAPELPDGTTAAGTEFPEAVAFNADVQPPPGITAIGPTTGSISGGTSVVITGHDFTGASAVKFGSTPASSFTVSSDTQITVVAPPTAIPGAVDTSVTTAAGTTTASAADQFTYTACVVPKLKGKKVKAARKALTKADCKLGKVKKLKGATTKTGKVKKQSPKQGKVLAPGAKVSVKLGA